LYKWRSRVTHLALKDALHSLFPGPARQLFSSVIFELLAGRIPIPTSIISIDSFSRHDCSHSSLLPQLFLLVSYVIGFSPSDFSLIEQLIITEITRLKPWIKCKVTWHDRDCEMDRKKLICKHQNN
jgi:hypothetical protein